MFVTYHIANAKYGIEKDSGWKVYTYIDDLGTRRVHKTKLCMPVVRSVVIVLMILGVNMSLYFFQKSGSDLNTGIIVSLFTTSVLWTTMYFYCAYG